MKRLLVCLLLAALAAPALCASEPVVLRVGYFPNVTHAQGVIGAESTRAGHGWFEQRLGPGVVVHWYAFNAGPSAMEALLAGSLDLTYVGPNPALNVYIRSRGDEIRVLAGAAEGGAALVVQGTGQIKVPADFKGLKLATPQLGNTQDVAARVWLKRQGFSVSTTGGDVYVWPTANPDQHTLFQAGKLDAAWTVEPWVSRLVLEAGARVFLDQPDAITTVLVARTGFLREHAELAESFRRAHAELTQWIKAHPDLAKGQVRAGLSAEAKREIPAAIIDSAWIRLHFTEKVAQEQFESLVADARTVGFLRDAIPLERMFSGKP